LGLEADHLPPSIVEVNDGVRLHLHSPIRLHGVVSSSAQGQVCLSNFTLSWSCVCGGGGGRHP